MSSKRVRDEIESQLITFLGGTPPLIDLTGRFEDFNKFLADQGITPKTPWVGLDFVGDPEFPITIPAHNLKGKYRETGVVSVHLVEFTVDGAVDKLLVRGKAMQDFLRGQNFNDIVRIESASPPNFEAGTTLKFEGGWTAATILAGYESDLNL